MNDDGVEIDVRDLRVRIRHCRHTDQDVFQRSDIHGCRPPVSIQKRIGGERADHRCRVGTPQRRQPDLSVLHQLDRATRRAQGHHRTEVAILYDAHQHLDSRGRHSLDHEGLHLLAQGTELLRDVFGRGLHVVRSFEVQANGARV